MRYILLRVSVDNIMTGRRFHEDCTSRTHLYKVNALKGHMRQSIDRNNISLSVAFFKIDAIEDRYFVWHDIEIILNLFK